MPIAESLTVTLSSFTLISLAEIGDKSQLVCMTLASRHRHWPVLLGASAAFIVLNLVAVVFGAAVANWIPETYLSWGVALLFTLFGLQFLFSQHEEDNDTREQRSGRNIFLVTFMMILLAEFGDKTQIAVAGLASNLAPLYVWIGATSALILVSAIGVWAGCALLQKLPLAWIHRLGGMIFLGFALFAAINALSL